MNYYAVYSTVDNRLISIGTVLPDELDNNIDYVEIEESVAQQALRYGYTWDSFNLNIIPNEVPDEDFEE